MSDCTVCNAKSLTLRLVQLGTQFSLDLRVKRDDLYPVTGGGNKARKMARILEVAESQGCNALVTTGGLQSNHARVAAMVAARKGWRCKLILHNLSEDIIHLQGNLLLMQLAGAEIEIVKPSDIAHSMRAAMDAFRSEGLTPYEIPGGGHSIAGAMAYVEAVEELKRQCQKDKWRPDWIILASGTGTTQAGIIVGLERLEWQTHVVGISIARKNPRGKNIVKQACQDLRTHLDMPEPSISVDFRDDWVGEGYEKAGEKVLETIRMVAKMDGLILDPTYTGKAFTALLDLVRSGEIKKGSNVLFWHTGGLLNLMASEYFTEGVLKL
jgi:1-aminocyclopropane-1-carboxylate deaminase/D-cysteine desulfhydrase-like pyridoxal-dependent ACC family enzyme